MTSLMHMLVDNYNEVLEAKKGSVVDSWLFMSSPLPVTGVLIVYLYFVLKLGPQWMAKKQPFNLTKVMIVYNAYQVLFSVWLCSQAYWFTHELYLLITQCNTYTLREPYATALYRVAWWYWFNKVVELLDTIFFVLRRKQSQVTFLHVYHHSIMMYFSWFYLKFIPGEQGIVIGFINTSVHSIMYFYYLLAALGPAYQKYLWWKKYMTRIQLTQFGIALAYLGWIVAMDCEMPKALSYFFVGHTIVFIYLFTDFYRKAYKKKGTNQLLEHDKKLHKAE